METVYKITILGKESFVKEIIVFSKDLQEEQIESPFNEKERAFIEKNSIPVKYAQQSIYKDDSIFTIKHKILKELSNPVSYHEMYLFSHIHKFHIQTILKNMLRTSGAIPIDEYKQILINLGIKFRVAEQLTTDKTAYTLEDMVELTGLIHDNTRYYKTSIGKRFRQSPNELFSANPYDMISLPNKKELWIQTSANPLESFENQLLLNNEGGKFLENTIFLCFAEDVLDFCQEKDINTEWAASIYFPLLIREDVFDLETLAKHHRKLLNETKKMTPSPNTSIDLLYDIHRKKSSDLFYSNRGVSEFSILLHPDFKHNLPLDVIFKNVHSTKSIPFIKYNPGPRRENLYRLYSESITKYGTKIPFLAAKTIIKLSKETGRNRQISFSVEHPKGDFYIHIFTNGDISISGNNFKNPQSIHGLNGVIKEFANPIIGHMNDFLKKNGYELKQFENLDQEDVEIEYIHYTTQMKLRKNIDWHKYKNCLQSVFEGNDPDFHKGAEFRYKRVENYSTMNEEDAFISGLFNHPREEIVHLISRKYDMELQQAALRLAQFLRDHEQQSGRFVKTSMKIADSPGFHLSMRIESYEDLFVCDLFLDNSIADVVLEYIDVFSIYIDSILRMTQEPSSTQVTPHTISKICSKNKEKEQRQKPKFDHILTGISTSILYDTFEENNEIEDIEDELPQSAFGNLDEYENADIEPEAIEDYEKGLSPIEEEGQPNESVMESLSPIEEQEIESLSPVEEESPSSSEESSSNSLMYMNEEEEPEQQEQEQKGGTPEKKLDGMLLKDSNNNIFLSRLKKKEPMLFLSEDDGKYSAFSKICQASRYRQPIILTPDEKERIDNNDKETGSKSYNHALEYGTDPENKNFYICPRYWCLKTNTPISEEEAKSGKCGKILPKGSKKVKPGHYVVEFNHSEQHRDKDGNYLENTPGFLEGNLHPKGDCMPCCFKKTWDSKAQVDRRKECQGITKTKTSKRTTKQETYIIDIRRYPIPPKRWGFLPISVQYFLQTDNSLAIDPNNNKYLRNDRTTQTLLRYGVENSATKSFIACIADLYAYKTNQKEVPSITHMCAIIASAVSIDLFLKYHNGSLASIFRPKTYELESINPTKYESSTFMTQLDQGNESHLDFIYDTIAAYENFVRFLKDEKSYIDHTYLWDVVCSPNTLLFPNGCNLAILRIRDVDMTDDIELLCPTAIYSSTLFDIQKESVILIKHDEFFEPVYLFHSKVINNHTTVTIHKTFREERSPIKGVLEIIRNSIQKYCPPKSSMPRTYTFSKSPMAENLRYTLLEYKFIIRAQVLNYKGKTVGFWIKYKNDGIYIPCFPSSPLTEIKTMFMDDPELWMSYKDTVDLLQQVYTRSSGKILSRPVFKIMEDEQVIGVLTETNQFIMISEPSEPEDDGIPVLKDENYIIADKVFAKKKQEDPVRTETIRKIKLETQFYGAFRTTVRILLNESGNIHHKQQIMKLVENKKNNVDSQDLIETILHIMCDNYVAFKEFDEETLASLEEISDCYLNPEDKKYCVLNNGIHQLILPKFHLVSGRSNADIYFSRIADELWRYKRIQLFMMNSKMYLNLTNTEYKINPDEMLLLESLLTPEYFKSLEPYQHGDTLITYETANPILTQKYNNEVSRKIQTELVTKDTSKLGIDNNLKIECVHSEHPVIGKKETSVWKKFFSSKSVEMDLHKTVKCSYYPIIYVYNQLYNTFLTVEQIKSILIAEYSNYGHHLYKILMILRKQGKRDMVDDIIKGKYTLETVIFTEVYFLTPLDLWVLAVGLKLPIVLFHQSKLKNLIDSVNWLRLYESSVYHFVRVPTGVDAASNFLPQYSIVKPAINATSPELIRLFSQGSDKSMISLYEYFQQLKMKPDANN